MRAADVSWADLAVQLVGATGLDRDIAEWQACTDVVRNMDAYAPKSFAAPEGWNERDWEKLNQWRSAENIDELRELANASPKVFGTWLVAVTNHEAAEASKLETLVWVLRTLYRLRDQSTDTALVDKLATRIGDALVMVWKCQTVPLEGDYRAWAIRHTRLYRDLPRHWRFL